MTEELNFKFCFILINLHVLKYILGFPGGASGKEPACQCRRCKVMRVSSLGPEDPLEEGIANHWRIP